MVNRPRSATPSLAALATNSAAASNNSWGVFSVRISTEEVKRHHSRLAAAQDSAPAASNRRTACRSQQPRFLVGDHLHWNCFYQRTQATLIEERLHEQRRRKLGENLRRDSACQEKSAGRHRLEGQIGSLGTVDGDPQVKRLLCQRRGTDE